MQFVRGGVIEPGDDKIQVRETVEKQENVTVQATPLTAKHSLTVADVFVSDSEDENPNSALISSSSRRYHTMNDLQFRKHPLILTEKDESAAKQQRVIELNTDVTPHRQNAHSTHISLGIVHHHVTTRQLCQLFGRIGPIAQVSLIKDAKIKNLVTASIAFMKRKDAERAIHLMNGSELRGLPMKMTWLEALPVLPNEPFFIHPQWKPTLKRNKPKLINHQSWCNVEPISNELKEKFPNGVYQVQVILPMMARRVVIDIVSDHVVAYGPAFEAVFIEKELPEYAFLWELKSPDHAYYRWRLFATLQGDNHQCWHTDPFIMYEEGNVVWIPPAMPYDDEGASLYDESSDEDEQNKDSLKEERIQLMLRSLTTHRDMIGMTMILCLQQAHLATTISDWIMNELVESNQGFLHSLALLYLISDILHNTGAPIPNAFKYRRAFEERLPRVFHHFRLFYESIQARLKAENVRQSVETVLDVWESWLIFPSETLKSWRLKINEIVEMESNQYQDNELKETDTLDSNSYSNSDFNYFDVSQLIDPDLDGEPWET